MLEHRFILFCIMTTTKRHSESPYCSTPEKFLSRWKHILSEEAVSWQRVVPACSSTPMVCSFQSHTQQCLSCVNFTLKPSNGLFHPPPTNGCMFISPLHPAMVCLFHPYTQQWFVYFTSTPRNVSGFCSTPNTTPLLWLAVNNAVMQAGPRGSLTA